MKALKEFNYTYPEFEGLKDEKPEELKKIISAKVNKLYGPSEEDLRAMAELSKGSTDVEQVSRTHLPTHGTATEFYVLRTDCACQTCPETQGLDRQDQD